jgi:hypothetical protein
VPTLQLPATTLPRPLDGSKLWGDGFEIETMINIRAAADGLKVGEVGSVEHARIHGESNLNTFRDGFRVLRTIFSEYGRMRRQRKTGRGGVIVHQKPATHRAQTGPAHAHAGPHNGLDHLINRSAPATAPHPADVRPHVNHLNRWTRRADDVRLLQTRAALED